jgi:DNA polymerase elongation subunit (family B)
MLFQHTASTLDDGVLTLYGRTSDGSCALHTALRPSLVCARHPKDVMDDAEWVNSKIASYVYTPGHNILQWGKRRFCILKFDSTRDYYSVRKVMRKERIPIFNNQVSLDSHWFIERDLRPCSAFEVTTNPCARTTTCDLEYNIATIQASDHIGIKPLVLSYDIECLVPEKGFPDAKKDPIITIGCYSSKESKCFCVHNTPGHNSYPTEKGMLNAFLAYVIMLDPDIITGHNINRFDNVYLRDRCKKNNVRFIWSRRKFFQSTIKHITTHSKQKGTQEQYRLTIPGRVIVDSYELYRAQHNLKSYKLDNIAKHFGLGGKFDMPYHLIRTKFREPEGRKEIADYCVQDCKLVLDLLEFHSKIVNLLQMGAVTGCVLDDILQRGQGIRTITLMLYYCKALSIFIPRSDVCAEGFQGAVVLPPKKGIYREVVACVDFASLYPSIMQAVNMCYSTLVSNEEIERNGWKEGVDVITVPDYDWVGNRLKITHNPDNCSFVTNKVREGVLPRILTDLLNERRKVKKQMKAHYGTDMGAMLNGKQLALKVVCNSVYGFTGAKKGFLSEPRIASSVTKYGRGLTLRTMDSVNSNPRWKGSEVIYGDSVSADTPLLLRVNGVYRVKRIDAMGVYLHRKDGKEFAEVRGVEVWSDKGWTQVHRVIRHKVRKKMYRVFTETSIVDVTEDHSLLTSKGVPVKPLDCTRDLMEVELPEFEINDCKLTYQEAYLWGVSVGTRHATYDVEIHKLSNSAIIPWFILTAPTPIVYAFHDGLMSCCKFCDATRRKTVDKELIMLYQILGHRLGYHGHLGSWKTGFRLTFSNRKPKPFFKVVELPHKEQYVYDLTTENHHFHVGPGKLVVHNTDSCFIKLSTELCSGEGQVLIDRAHQIGTIIANDITRQFRNPVLMEYECCFKPPFVLLKKKRYFGNMCLEGKDPKIYMKGVECIRRDFCDLVIKTQKHMIELILDDKIEDAVAHVRLVMDDLHKGNVSMEDLIMSKKLSQAPEHYKTVAPHVELAKRLGANGPQAGDRVEYLIRAGFEPLNQRAILVSEASIYRLDYKYYAERQLHGPIQRILDVVVGYKVFRHQAVTAATKAGSIVKFLNVGERRKRRKLNNPPNPHTGVVTAQDIRRFFG